MAISTIKNFLIFLMHQLKVTTEISSTLTKLNGSSLDRCRVNFLNWQNQCTISDTITLALCFGGTRYEPWENHHDKCLKLDVWQYYVPLAFNHHGHSP
jgi:hypothetical protein